MAINVIDSENRILAPTMQKGWVNKLIKQGKAKYISKEPPTIQLNYAVVEVKKSKR